METCSFLQYLPAGRDEQHANIVLDIRNVETDTATDVSVEHPVSAHNIVGQTMHFASMLPKAVGRLSIPVPLPQRGVNTQIHLKYEYRDIFKETDKEYHLAFVAVFFWTLLSIPSNG
jgi:hypothetical protein